tara:strand:- start:820 stop:1095 length:276 start_codon:yes stop_codon:yes gene_type:complete
MEDVKVYMVVNLEIEDKDTYLKYEKGFFPILKRHGGEFITFDDSFKHMEGPEPLSGGRMIIFSFPSETAAEACTTTLNIKSLQSLEGKEPL